MSKAVRPHSTTIKTLTAGAAISPPRLIQAPLEARFVRLACPVAVTFAKPVGQGRPELVTGCLLGTMHARGAVHHYRVVVAGVLWLVPPVWLTPASAAAVAAPSSQNDPVARMRTLRVLLQERNCVEAGA
jgi:hypothetical protein